MAERCDILITGGGLNGPALAIALAELGFRVTIVDALPESALRAPGFDGRAYALALAARRMLARLGLWDQVADHAQPILDIRVGDGRPGEGAHPATLHFDHAELGEGPLGFMVEDRHLRGALLDRMAALDVTRIGGREVVAQSGRAAGAEVALDDGRTVSTTLLVGCDGRQSATATRAGIRRMGRDYAQTALVAAIAHEAPHGGCAYQLFMPQGPIGILPLKGNVSSIVWSEDRAAAEAITALDDDAFLEALRPRFGEFLGAITLAGTRFSYPLGLSLAQSFIAGRVALVGDAAHGIHPLAGQGLNLGLRDVAALTEVLRAARARGEDIGTAPVLARYQRWRRADTTMLACATDGINTLFSNDNPALRAARIAGLGAVASMPALRRGLMREAAGLTGDLPPLMV